VGQPVPEGPTILIVDDEPQIRRFLRIALVSQGFVVLEASGGAQGLELAAMESPQLIILDLGLPDMDGQEVLVQLREWSRVPVLVLSVRSQERQKVLALERGANDYVTKPFGIGELVARVRVLLRDQPEALPMQATYCCKDLEIDGLRRQVTVGGQIIHLSRKEFALLWTLAQHQSLVVTHQQLLRAVWGEQSQDDVHYLRIFVGHLRRKLGDDPTSPRYIATELGVGYRLLPDR
jgi:two-component system KDP operon response regulator KdpE